MLINFTAEGNNGEQASYKAKVMKDNGVKTKETFPASVSGLEL